MPMHLHGFVASVDNQERLAAIQWQMKTHNPVLGKTAQVFDVSTRRPGLLCEVRREACTYHIIKYPRGE